MGRVGRTAVVMAALLALATWAPGATAQSPPPSVPPTPPAGATPTTALALDDSDEVELLVDESLVVVAEKVAVLDLLGAFVEPIPPPLDPIIVAVDRGTSQTRDELVAELDDLDAAGDELLVDLEEEVGLSREVVDTLGYPSDDVRGRLEAGETAVLDAGPYLSAIDDLVTRNGRPPGDGVRGVVDAGALAQAVLVASGDVDAPDATAPPDGTSPPDGTARDGSAPDSSAPDTSVVEGSGTGDDRGSASDDDPPWLIIGLGVLVLGALVAALVALRRRGSGGTSGQFDELLEVSRTLSLARTPADVERIAAEETARLLGGGGPATGAVVRRTSAGLEVGYETLDGVLVPDRLGDGLLHRVVETGQSIDSVVDHEPALRSLPAAFVAVPVIGGGRVEGVVLAVRTPEQPFADDEVGLLRKLGPIVAAALDSARHADASAAASLTDPLTEVGNRRKLERDLPVALLGATDRTALVMVDLDHFKGVNDTYGHPAGDALLRAVAEVLREVMRPGDGVYRYGGEEFALVLPATAEEAAVQAADRAREAIGARDFDLGDGNAHRVTASLGVAATWGTDDTDDLGLIARADRALYEAKERGRDRVVAASTLEP